MEGARLEQRRSQALIKLLFKYGELNVIYYAVISRAIPSML